MPGAIANLQRHIDRDTLKSWGAADEAGNRLKSLIMKTTILRLIQRMRSGYGKCIFLS
jgi:hypothetical protein